MSRSSIVKHTNVVKALNFGDFVGSWTYPLSLLPFSPIPLMDGYTRVRKCSGVKSKIGNANLFCDKYAKYVCININQRDTESNTNPVTAASTAVMTFARQRSKWTWFAQRIITIAASHIGLVCLLHWGTVTMTTDVVTNGATTLSRVIFSR